MVDEQGNPMTKQTQERLLVGVEVGASKVAVVIGSTSEDGQLKIIGANEVPSKGIKRGQIVDVESLVYSLQRAIENIELMTHCEVFSVYMGVDNQHVSLLHSVGVTSIPSQQVEHLDVLNAAETAIKTVFSYDYRTLHALADYYFIDSQFCKSSPLGLQGARLTTYIDIINCSERICRDLTYCMSRNERSIDQFIHTQLAVAYSILTQQERELGVCLIDIGSDTTNIVMFCHGRMEKKITLPIAGHSITRDIAMICQVPISEAENIKQSFQFDVEKFISHLKTDKESSSPFKKDELILHIMGFRLLELFDWISESIALNHIDKSSFFQGFVLTGGSSAINDIDILAEHRWKYPVRIGRPLGVSSIVEINNHSLLNATSLIKYANDQYTSLHDFTFKPPSFEKKNRWVSHLLKLMERTREQLVKR
ncbi:cell division protein FtsA [Pleionea sediminis]|uniref:cell division protein FtsA n=1 Tax=Pleionea sediminis TaxID=2569479 RepID=UPI0011853B5C|nr:cell division protein FtsA [Pleionea sediminis]